VKLFGKPNSKFYWYDFTVRGRRYRGSTQETKSARAAKAAFTCHLPSTTVPSMSVPLAADAARPAGSGSSYVLSCMSSFSNTAACMKCGKLWPLTSVISC
jgi:hypothetical protein